MDEALRARIVLEYSMGCVFARVAPVAERVVVHCHVAISHIKIHQELQAIDVTPDRVVRKKLSLQMVKTPGPTKAEEKRHLMVHPVEECLWKGIGAISCGRAQFASAPLQISDRGAAQRTLQRATHLERS